MATTTAAVAPVPDRDRLAVLGVVLLLVPIAFRKNGRRSLCESVCGFVAVFLFATNISCGGGSSRSYDHEGEPIDDWPSDAVLYLGDHQNTVVAVVDAQGDLVQETAYHAYGTVRATRGPVTDAYGYAANERDGTGLGHFGARPYRYDAAVFLGVDPLLLSPANGKSLQTGLVPYGYTAGNPVLYRDPDGQESKVHETAKLVLKIRSNVKMISKVASDNGYAIGYWALKKGANQISGGILSSFSKALPITAYTGKMLGVLDLVSKNADSNRTVLSAIAQAGIAISDYETRAAVLGEMAGALRNPLDIAAKETLGGVTFEGWDDPYGFDESVKSYRGALKKIRGEVNATLAAGDALVTQLELTRQNVEHAAGAHDVNPVMLQNQNEYERFMSGPADGMSPIGRLQSAQKELVRTQRRIDRKLDALPPE